MQFISDLGKEVNFADVTLVSEDQIQTPAHKVVLSACSPVLKSLLLENPHTHPLLCLTGVKQTEISALLNFMYCGEAEVPQDRILDFFSVAKDLEVKEICKETRETLKQHQEDADLVQGTSESHSRGFQNESYEDAANNYFEMSIKEEEADDSSTTMTIDNAHSLIGTDWQSELMKRELSSFRSQPRGATSNQDRRFQCDQCDATFSYASHVRRHIKIKHEGVRFPCPECGYECTTAQSLRTHYDRKHTSVRFPCPQCEFKAVNQAELNRHHSMKHNGERVRFPCPQCEYKATEKGSLRNHIRSQHEGIRYPCPKCEYKASEKGHLKKHIRKKHDGMNIELQQLQASSLQTEMSIKEEPLEDSMTVPIESEDLTR